MSIYTTGIIVGITLGVILLFVMAIKNKTNGHKYDERQLAIQGKAFKISYFITIIGGMLLGVCEDNITQVMKLSAAMVAWMFISGLVLIGYQVFHDAYFGINFQKKHWMLLYAAVAVSQIVIGVSRASEGKLYENSIITLEGALPFITGVFFTCFLVIILVKKIMDRNETDE